jgi:predicted RNA binding protein YcfA (HicA-like mRNA interferase family)
VPGASATSEDHRVQRFPSVKAARLLAVLTRAPLNYRVVRQVGSHRRLVSDDPARPPVVFAFHSGVTVPPWVVRHILVDTVGLDEREAVRLL